jgi:hypothetical protein
MFFKGGNAAMSALVDFLSNLIASLISAALVHFGAIAIAEGNSHEPMASETVVIESEISSSDKSKTGLICLGERQKNEKEPEVSCTDPL